MKIFKYKIEKDRNAYGDFSLETPDIYQILHVKEINNEAFVWIAVDEDTEITRKNFVIVPTEAPIIPAQWDYVGTFNQDPFVWHLFYKP